MLAKLMSCYAGFLQFVETSLVSNWYNFCKDSELLSISYKNWRKSVDLRSYLHKFSKLASLLSQTDPLKSGKYMLQRCPIGIFRYQLV